MSASRRDEILLPLRFNDGQPDPEEHFGAVSWETQVIRGAWQQSGRRYQDDLIRVFVDVSDSRENRAFFTDLKKRLKAKFRELDIWLMTYTIDVL